MAGQGPRSRIWRDPAGTLSLDADDCCPDWGTAALPVPDVIEEMVSRVLEDGGEVTVITDGSSPVAARLSLTATAPSVPPSPLPDPQRPATA